MKRPLTFLHSILRRTRSERRGAVAITAAPESGGPVNTPTAAYVEDVATVTPVGRDGWNGQPQMWVEFVTLSRPSRTTGWSVSGVETAP